MAILALNGPEFFELEFACGKIGAILVPLNWRLTENELAYILGDCSAEGARPRRAVRRDGVHLSSERCEIDRTVTIDLAAHTNE